MTGDATFASELRRLREARSLTQEELADRAGITGKAVGALERGERTRPYPHTVRALAEALELDESELAQLVARIPVRGGAPAMPEPSAGGVRPFPAATTTLIGRETELAAVRGLIAADQRLVSLTGPGGVGKTRLALELLHLEAADRPGGAAFVEFAEVPDAGLIVARVAAALGVPESRATGEVAGLASALADRSMLLVLDNLEHLLPPGAGIVAELVASCPELVVVVTSRAALRVRAEHEVALAPLSVPLGSSRADVEASAAGRLFLDRAAAAGGPGDLDDRDLTAVAEICRRLDGIPLAVELVAAGTKMLTPVALVERLDSVTGSLNDLPDRQRSMAATIDWSLDLLDGDAVALFRRLAVCEGGFSLETASAVTEDDDVLGPLGELVDHSLVTRVGSSDGGPRFRLLEPLRQYAGRMLRDSPDADDAADRHAAWFHQRAMHAADDLRGAGLAMQLDLLEADHGNLRAAHQRLLERGRVADAAEAVGSVWLYLALRGHAREGLTWVAHLRSDLAAMPDLARCRALTGRMGLLFATGDIDRLREDAGVADTLARRHPDRGLAAETLTLAGHAAVFVGDWDTARSSLDLALGWADEAGADWVRIHALVALGQLALARGELDRAERALTRALALARELGNVFSLATALTRTATVSTLRGDDVSSAALLGESIDLSVEARMSWTLSYALPALAGVAARLGQPATAVQLFAASASLSAAYAVDPRFPVSRRLADQDLAGVRESLGETAFAEAWDAGRAASQADLVEAARRVTRLARA